jgi:hypothetical protein
MSKRLFAVVKITEPKKMAELIEANFPSRWKLNEDTWLVAGEFTVMEVAEKLHVGEHQSPDREEGEYGSAVVLGVHAYYGRASDHLWDWMRVKSDVLP